MGDAQATLDKPEGEGASNTPQYTEDLMTQFRLASVLSDLRSRKLRSSFSHYISELSTEVVPLKPRCPAGRLAEIALQPVNEDERRLELFDERVLRNALTLKEGGETPPLPDWLEVEQPWGDDEKRKKRRDKKRKKKRKKRKRNAEGEEEDDEKRAKKKRK